MNRSLVLKVDDLDQTEFCSFYWIFEDDTAVCNVVAMIFGTDYSFQFPIVEDGNIIPVTDNKVDLYLHIFPPQLLPMNILAAIGLI
uniref:Flavin-containing monooxygenase n=2 Tax=Brugia malayi TaxID=6279 RepID=A0A0J9Y6F4_BRUMA|nr:Bm13355 [Brugia malayi]